MIKKEISNLIEKAIKKNQEQGIFPVFSISEILVAKPEEKIFGDYSTNAAMVIAKQIKKNPLEIAENLKSEILNLPMRPNPLMLSLRALSRQAIGKAKIFDKVEIKKPGFLNFFLSEEYLQKQVGEILKQDDNFGNLKIGKHKKINIEFISANPTGPLTLGNGRGGFCGDVLANVLEKVSCKIIKEYYVNDVGEQVKKLGHSVIGDSEAVYKGDYIYDLRKKIKGNDSEKIGEQAAKIILEKIIKPTIKKMGIKFDVWFSEKNLYKEKECDKILEQLKNKNLTYENQGALWFKTTDFGDDKDRVLIKADKQMTYFASDIAYLKNKFKRGFDKLIYFWGADHYGYIDRLKAAAEALGYKKEQINVIIMQMVRVFENGKETRMSKRSGVYITLDELIDEVGLDVSRFFFLTRSPDTHLNFDLNLAKECSAKNPVFYIQYAFARIHSILAKSKIKNQKSKIQLKIKNLKLLNHPSESDLIKQLIRFPEIIEDIVKDYQVQRLPVYALELVASFHKFYEDCRVISDIASEKELTQSRLALVLATKIVLKNTLDLMGISAPQKM
ncbi:arginine--tRNA ligase [Patescibacteria group bacterium]|nr:arginine--tRNA ligase [Patescibacteria group bacterium]